MTTIYECIQKYYKQPDSVRFTKTKIRKIANYCKYAYDIQFPGTITFTISEEDGEIFNVRYYPDKFKKVINRAIQKAHNSIISNKSKETINQEISEALNGLKNIKVKKERKKIAIKKPEFSAKPKKIVNG